MMKDEKKENNFYSFREIIKEDLYETTFKELLNKVSLLRSINLNSTKQAPEKVASDWSDQFQKLIALAEDIIKDRCEKEQKNLYGYGKEVIFDDKLIMNVKRVTIARLACFLVDHQNYFKKKHLHGLVLSYLQTLEEFGSLDLRNEYSITQFIHCSRGLLDTENPKTGIKLMNQLISESTVDQLELNDVQRKIFTEVETFWKENVVGSASFYKAIGKFKECYKLSATVEEIRELLKVMPIDFVDSDIYYGMVGFNGILLSELAFQHTCKDKELAMRFILTTIIHECAHYILRITNGDFGFLSPRNGHGDVKRQRLEAGYLLEDILFGNAWKEASYYQHLMKPEIWESDIPIIPKEDMACLTLKSEKDNLCTSGFLMAETKKWK
jgi:hypothetical protein